MKIKFIPNYVEEYCQAVLGKSFMQAIDDNFETYRAKIFESAKRYQKTKLEMSNDQ